MIDADPPQRGGRPAVPRRRGSELAARRLTVAVGHRLPRLARGARPRATRVPFARVEELVRPERAKVNREAHRERWWQFGETRPALYRAIAPLRPLHRRSRCVSKVVQPMFVPTGIVSRRTRSSSSPTTTMPISACCRAASTGGGRSRARRRCETDIQLHADRLLRDVRPARADRRGRHPRRRAERAPLRADARPPGGADEDVQPRPRSGRARRRHRPPARAARRNSTTRSATPTAGPTSTSVTASTRRSSGRGSRSRPAPRQEVLDRLLELNHERYAEEVAQGLHGKPKAKGKRKAAPAGSMAMELDGV